MIYDIVLVRTMTKQVFIESDSEEEALDKIDQIFSDDIPLDDWNNDNINPNEDDIREFQNLRDAREFYDNGGDIPAYRVIAGQLFEIEEETNG